MTPIAGPTVAERLLGWYDGHARALPWRAVAGEVADPYRVWLSEIMLQQTTVATVRARFAAFTARWPTLAALAAADEAEVMAAWAGLGYYARARNLIACARTLVADHAGLFPSDETALRALPGIGDYTAAAIAAIAFGKHAVVVDANVERVVARLFAVESALPAARAAIRGYAASITPQARAGDFAQAMMDLASSHCRPKSADCDACPLRAPCAAAATGAPERYPAKTAKPPKPQRFGTAFWLERGDQVLLVRRPARGLLGGMRALPTGPWQESPPGLCDAPVPQIAWTLASGAIRHVFTHFRLELALAIAATDGHSEVQGGEWWPIAEVESAGLPTVFAKAARIRAARIRRAT